MLNVLDLAEQDTRLHRASVRELAGPCPNPDCGRKTDGFRVQQGKNQFYDQPPRGGFMCRGCWDPARPPLRPEKPRWGDPIDYLMHVRKMSFKQARASLDGQNGTVTHSAPVWDESRIHPAPAANDWHSPQWQEVVHQAVQAAQARPWSPEDTLALDFARRRGLSDEMIRKARLGYGLQGGIPRLVIPSNNGGQYVAIYRRDLRADVAKEQRWRDVPGGTKSELYLADCLLRYTRPTVMTEAALDALSLVQECGDSVNVIATGGVNCGKLDKWLELLRTMLCVLIAFDRDAAGEQEAQWWLQRLPNARRLRPYVHDVNAMLMQGWDLRHWIMDALQDEMPITISKPAAEPAPPIDMPAVPSKPTPLPGGHSEQPTTVRVGDTQRARTIPPDIAERARAIDQIERAAAEQDDGLDTTCWTCLTSLAAMEREFAYSATGVAYCQHHVPPPEMQAAASRLIGYARRRVEECFGPCTVSIDPPGYTLAERVRNLGTK